MFEGPPEEYNGEALRYSQDGYLWCCQQEQANGDLQEYVAGFGETQEEAFKSFKLEYDV